MVKYQPSANLMDALYPNSFAMAEQSRQPLWNDGMTIGLKPVLVDLMQKVKVGQKITVLMRPHEKGIAPEEVRCVVKKKYRNLCILEYKKSGLTFRMSPSWVQLFFMMKSEGEYDG